MGVCLTNLLRYVHEGTDFIAKIVARGETWCHYFDPASKWMSIEWRRRSSPRPEKAHSAQKAWKVLLTHF